MASDTNIVKGTPRLAVTAAASEAMRAVGAGPHGRTVCTPRGRRPPAARSQAAAGGAAACVLMLDVWRLDTSTALRAGTAVRLYGLDGAGPLGSYEL